MSKTVKKVVGLGLVGFGIFITVLSSGLAWQGAQWLIGAGLLLWGSTKKPKVNSSTTLGTELQMSGDPLDVRVVIYGEAWTAGTLRYRNATNTDNKDLYMVIVLAGHECDSVQAVQADKQTLTIDGSGNVTAPSQYVGLMNIRFVLGTDSQTVDTTLDSTFTDWTSNHRLRGLTYAIVKLTFNETNLSSVPQFRFKVKGRKVYDPRLDSTNGGTGSQRIATPSTWAWSRNAVLCARDYLGGILINGTRVAGVGVSSTRFSWANVIAEANVCDEDVALAAGGTEDRYTVDGVIDPRQSHEEVKRHFELAIAGDIILSDAKWRFFCGAYRTPSLHLQDAHFIGPMRHVVHKGEAERFDTASGQYAALIAESGSPVNYAPVSLSTVTVGSEKIIPLNLQLVSDRNNSGTSDGGARAQRIAKLILEREAAGKFISCTTSLYGYRCMPGETVLITRSGFGLSSQAMRVVDVTLRLMESGDRAGLVCDLTLEAGPSSLYSWSATETAIAASPSLVQLTVPSTNIDNSTITINANGTLSGAGSGQASLTSLPGTISAGQILAGAVTTTKLAVIAPGSALNADPGMLDSAAWVVFAYNQCLFATVTDGQVGAGVARSPVGGSKTWMNGTPRIPVDSAKTYRVRAWMRTISGTGSTSFMGVALYDSSGVTIANPGGGSQWYYAASGVTPGASWTEYTGTFGAGTARTIHANARTMTPLFYFGEGGGTSVVEIQDLRIEEIIPTTLIADGAITTAKILANNVTADKLSTSLAFVSQALTLGTGATLSSGQTNYDTGTGYWLDYNGGTPRFSIGNSAANKLTWNGTTLSIVGTVSGSLAAGSLSGTVGLSNTNIAARGWTNTAVFSATSATQVNWAAGTFTSADGTSYSIASGNTGTMAARTYIYLDIGVSTTAFQTTTTATTAIGSGKVLVATAINGTGEARFQAFGGVGGQNIDAADIVSGSITASEIAANTITANEIASTLTWTKDLTISTAGKIKQGKSSASSTTAGFWLGDDGGSSYDFHIGNSTAYLWWDGSDGSLTVKGSIDLQQSETSVTPTWTSGWSVNPTGNMYFRKSGNIVFVRCDGACYGTASGGNFSFSLPSPWPWPSAQRQMVVSVYNAGALQPATLTINTDGTCGVVPYTGTAGGFSGSGNKGFTPGSVFVYSLD